MQLQTQTLSVNKALIYSIGLCGSDDGDWEHLEN